MNRRVIIRDERDSYGYAPRDRYIERRGYEDPGSIGFSVPGVSVGIGSEALLKDNEISQKDGRGAIRGFFIGTHPQMAKIECVSVEVIDFDTTGQT